MNNTLYFVVPCYNEAEVLPSTANQLADITKKLISNGKISENSRILFVNDGSTDKTWDIIESLNKDDRIFTGISLSRNRGHQNALLAGLFECENKADAVISIDADLQDDITACEEMVDKFLSGCDIVYGVRKKRSTDTFLKRFTAEFFYRAMNLLGAEIIFNHADFRLLSRRAVNELKNFKEVNLFLRGIIPLIGFRSDYVYYERKSRNAGKSKYSLSKMISFAADGITSLSIKPLRAIITLGITAITVSVILAIIELIKAILSFSNLFAWFITLMIFLSGVNLTALGIVGEYIGKIYAEVKARPRFIVEKRLDKE